MRDRDEAAEFEAAMAEVTLPVDESADMFPALRGVSAGFDLDRPAAPCVEAGRAPDEIVPASVAAWDDAIASAESGGPPVGSVAIGVPGKGFVVHRPDADPVYYPPGSDEPVSLEELRRRAL